MITGMRGCCEDIFNILKDFCIEHESVFSSVNAGRLCHCWRLFYLFIVKGAITNSLKNGFCGKGVWMEECVLSATFASHKQLY